MAAPFLVFGPRIKRIKRIEEKLFYSFFKRRNRLLSHFKCDQNSCNSWTKKVIAKQLAYYFNSLVLACPD